MTHRSPYRARRNPRVPTVGVKAFAAKNRMTQAADISGSASGLRRTSVMGDQSRVTVVQRRGFSVLAASVEPLN
jgi:hypothetical protein